MGLATQVKTLVGYRELFWMWVLRELKARYIQSLFGVAWAILQPIATSAIFVLVFALFVKIPSDGIPYPIFVFAAMLPWNFFTRSIGSGVVSIVANMNLVTKIYFPREILPLSTVFSNFVDFLCGAVVFIVLMIAYRVPARPSILLLPVLLLIQIILTAGISFLMSALNVYYRDVNQMTLLVLQLWMYACPIIYPTSLVPAWLLPYYLLNPMAVVIDGYRKVLIQGVLPDWGQLGIAAAISLFVLWFGYTIFKRMEDKFADVI